MQLLQKSDAVSMLPESVVRDHLQAGLLVRLPLTVGRSLPGFGILSRRGEPLSVAAGELVESLRHYGALMVQRSTAVRARKALTPRACRH